MAASRSAVLPPRVDFIHRDNTNLDVRGVKMNKGVSYSYANGRNNNIEKGGSVVQLPFLYQAPSVRHGNSSGVSLAHLKSTPNSTHRRRSNRRTKESSSNHLPLLPNLPPPAPAIENGDSLSQLFLRGSSKPLNPKASTSSSEAVPTSRISGNRVRYEDNHRGYLTTPFSERRHLPYSGLRQNGIIVSASDSDKLPLLSLPLPQRAKSANDVREETPSNRSGNHLHAPVVQSLSTQSLRETAEQATQTVMYQAVASVEYLDKAKVSTATPYYYRRKSEMVSFGNDEAEEEKEALMGVIEDALGETIDRYSRQRTSQLIARNVRKQAEIWRDAKDFVMTSLIPQSIQAANKSRRRKQTAAEIVGNIKMYP
ncbi:hypothetical protein PFISCL1PPCAC_26937 [Pristionchus fissidentatus]|uniref:Uncharacterized protein n=1 Tax=Pristionchus fissidentatus TaxID=1538716 RepID=A0AAV5WYC5_9BILA|nr:hypothetical protein PFISCL1PPCAC_26937 [Pristionchus fissidentatus]